jgi:hypothetical protein
MAKRLPGISAAVRAAILAAGLAAAPAVAESPQGSINISGVTLPARIAGIPRDGKVQDYEKTSPGLGRSVQFLRKNWRIDVYVYDLKKSSIPNDPASAVIREQLAQAKGDILQAEKQGSYANVVVRGEYTANDSKGRTRFACLVLDYWHKSTAATVDSYLCVTGVNNKFFKIRMTTPKNPETIAFARQFVEAWMPVLWPQ